ncbi:CU044_5270 family protein [Nonomuraea sp. NPDC050643]|uniref:CU044_5270 family protein n=1 Tax=Nonomuraea sp. NPDC050643 TaxID=3155660 RepID=UPI00340C8123
MNDLDSVKRLRRSTPTMTPQAEQAARARLLAAMREPAPRRLPRRRPAWRPAIAAALTVVVGGTWVATREPVMTPVADVRELSERAADAAERSPDPGTRTGQWLYIKELKAAHDKYSGYGVSTSKRVTWEQWTSVDGKKVASFDEKGRLDNQFTHPGIGAAQLAKEPVTPETVLDRLRAVLAPLNSAGGDPLPAMNELLFQSIYQLMGEQALPPEVRAALFRALPTIEGVTVIQDATDAGGRRGIAFSHTGDWARYDLILSSEDYRFLGTYGESVIDKTFTWTGGKADVPAGTPVTWTAQLETALVNEPGQRP